MISAVILAAGPTADQNLFSLVHHKPLLQWVLESALASDLNEIVCVTRDLAAVRREIRVRDRRLCWFANAAADRGQSSSVIAGLWASHPQSDGIMFLDGERMPAHKDLINLLIARFAQSAASIVAPGSAGQVGSPALFRRDLFPELLKLTGNRSERSLLEHHAEKIALVEWQEDFLPPGVIDGENRARLKNSI